MVPFELVIGLTLTCCVWMSRGATPCCLITAITRAIALELAASARAALEPVVLVVKVRLTRFGFALTVASPLTVIVRLVDLEPHAVASPSMNTATTARARVERFIGPPRGAVDWILTRRAAGIGARLMGYVTGARSRHSYAARSMPAPVIKDQELELRIESLAFGGNGVARLEGFVLFVRRGLPGDLVRARVTKVKRSHAEAETVEVLEPGPSRVET